MLDLNYWQNPWIQKKGKPQATLLLKKNHVVRIRILIVKGHARESACTVRKLALGPDLVTATANAKYICIGVRNSFTTQTGG